MWNGDLHTDDDKPKEVNMIDTYNGIYTFQPDTNNCLTDNFCHAIIENVKEYGNKHNMSIEKITNTTDYFKHNQQINVDEYFLKHGEEQTHIEEAADYFIALYEAYMEDEASDFGLNPYYIGKPYSMEDITVFVRENLIEYWA